MAPIGEQRLRLSPTWSSAASSTNRHTGFTRCAKRSSPSSLTFAKSQRPERIPTRRAAVVTFVHRARAASRAEPADQASSIGRGRPAAGNWFISATSSSRSGHAIGRATTGISFAERGIAAALFSKAIRHQSIKSIPPGVTIEALEGLSREFWKRAPTTQSQAKEERHQRPRRRPSANVCPAFWRSLPTAARSHVKRMVRDRKRRYIEREQRANRGAPATAPVKRGIEDAITDPANGTRPVCRSARVWLHDSPRSRDWVLYPPDPSPISPAPA